jgi:hypothetical protein
MRALSQVLCGFQRQLVEHLSHHLVRPFHDLNRNRATVLGDEEFADTDKGRHLGCRMVSSDNLETIWAAIIVLR